MSLVDSNLPEHGESWDCPRCGQHHPYPLSEDGCTECGWRSEQ